MHVTASGHVALPIQLPRFGTRAVVVSTDPGLSARRLPHNAMMLLGTSQGGTLELDYDHGKTARVTLAAGMTTLEALLALRKQVPAGYRLPIDRYDASSLVFGVQKLGTKNEPYDVTADIRAARGEGTESGPVITKRELDGIAQRAALDGFTNDERAELKRGVGGLLAESRDYLTGGARRRYHELERTLGLLAVAAMS